MLHTYIDTHTHTLNKHTLHLTSILPAVTMMLLELQWGLSFITFLMFLTEYGTRYAIY